MPTTAKDNLSETSLNNEDSNDNLDDELMGSDLDLGDATIFQGRIQDCTLVWTSLTRPLCFG